MTERIWRRRRRQRTLHQEGRQRKETTVVHIATKTEMQLQNRFPLDATGATTRTTDIPIPVNSRVVNRRWLDLYVVERKTSSEPQQGQIGEYVWPTRSRMPKSFCWPEHLAFQPLTEEPEMHDDKTTIVEGKYGK